jgi:endoglucanase
MSVLRRSALLLLPPALAVAAAPGRAAERRPNVVFILADDLGYGDVGAYGQRLVRTPNIDRLAAAGLRFTDFYAGSTVCAPSRAVLMTGRHTGHASVRGNAGGGVLSIQALREGERTVAHLFRDAGYATALFGKWGLGETGSPGHPNRMGFDTFFGYLNQRHAHNYYPSFLVRDGARVPLGNVPEREDADGAGLARTRVAYAHDRIVDEALAWIDANRSRPFFLCLAVTLPHANNEATAATGDGQEVPDHGEYAREPWPKPDRGQAAMVARLDRDVGRVLARLEQHGIASDTLVLFSSDNGPHQEGGNDPERFDANGPLRGLKRALHDGGIRVPTIARWPGRVPAGTVSGHVGYFGDFFATFADLLGQDAPAGLDSVSLLPTLSGRAAEQKTHEYLYWEFYEQGGRQAVRFGPWKAIREPMKTGRVQLHDLATDVGETEDLAARRPDLVARAVRFMDEAHVPDPRWTVSGSPPPGWPRVTLVDAAAPDVLHVVVQTGEVVRGKQVPYVKEPGDVVHRSITGTTVTRNGRELGGLVGKDESLLFPFERVLLSDFTPERWRQVTRALVRSAEDPEYRGGRPPEAVHLKTRPFEVSRVGGWQFEAPLEHHFYFRLPKPLVQGATYGLSVADAGPAIPPYTHAPRTTRSEAVHVSQVGFRPDDPSKRAFLSTWTGTGGGLRYPEGLPFEVVEEETSASVFEGVLRLARRAEDHDDRASHSHVKADVHEADFSPLTRPGVYRVLVKGIGTSFPFPVADDAWRKAFVTSARGFYHQRRSVELGPPFTDYVRPPGLDPRHGKAVLLSTTGLMDTGNGLDRKARNNFDDLVAGATTTPAGDGAWGGLMDAGDWDSRAQHLVVTRYLLELVELRPAFFRGVSLGIPESANALPDVVDEALFNLDHYRRMQLPDGGVRGGVESEEHPRYGEASWQESLRVFAYTPDVWSTTLYAGAAARAAFVLEVLGARTDAVPYRESAARALRWAESRPAEERTRYPELRDTRALAAAELFRLTGDPQWHRLFLETGDCAAVASAAGRPQDAASRGGGEQRDAAFVYALTRRPGVDERVRGSCRAALVADGDRLVEASGRTAFRWARIEGDAVGWAGFGITDGVALARAHHLTGETRYLAALVDAAQMTAGANPLNLSYTTGVGSRFPRRPLHVDSNVTGQAPPPGITVAGPIDQGAEWDETFARVVRPYLRPEHAEWPKLETYWESFWYPPITEYTVQWPMAQNAYVWGTLAARPPLAP